MTIELHDSRVLVVGASGGIGAATARAFGDAGARVTAAGRPSQRLDSVGEEIGGTTAQLDVLDNDAIVDFFSRETVFDHVVIAAVRAWAFTTEDGRPPSSSGGTP
jgi:NADP-dependent 3-hydroxy acid dehydrogenase YdfG